jgi:hypothetical protein
MRALTPRDESKRKNESRMHCLLVFVLRIFQKSKSSLLFLKNISFGFPNNYPDVYIIGCYHGTTKPEANQYMQDFVDDYLKHSRDHFEYEGKTVHLKIRSVVMDSPAKVFILQIKGHSGYYSCTRCIIEGKYNEHKVVFPLLN